MPASARNCRSIRVDKSSIERQIGLVSREFSGGLSDQFTLTSQIQTREGWLPHPLDEQLREGQGGKLRRIPIRLLFNDPDLNLRAEYSLFDRNTARPLCVGDG